MECHKCKYNGKADKHCLSCVDALDNPNNHGVCFVSFDALQAVRSVEEMIEPSTPSSFEPEPWEIAMINEESENTENGFLAVPMNVEQACRKLLAVFSQLNDTEIHTVLDLNNNLTLDEIGEKRGTSRQSVHIRLKRIVKKHKEFAYLLPKIARLNKKTCTNAKTGKGELKKRGTNE
jgi:predicted DNA-binding protein YlxM (UPF0122 family)